ncbi:MAG: hypothetical protein PWQ10_383 [Patescibacteria group bacterium]|nr:hypothetical protein [Patescibacteria group bacterium]
MKRIKIITLTLSLLVLCLIAFSGVAQAQSIKTGNSVAVADSETIDEMLFAGGNNINIAGNVNGDVYCAGQNITISGTINGDVFCIGQNINISGVINGGARLASQSLTISGVIKNSATVAAQTLLLNNGSSIGQDFVVVSQSTTIDGTVRRDIVANLSSLNINGTVGRNIIGTIENLEVGPIGTVDGSVNYTSDNTPVVSDGGQVKGAVSITPFKKQSPVSHHSLMRFAIATILYVYITSLIVVLIVSLLIPRLLSKTSDKAIKSFGRIILIGIISAITIPILVFVLLASFIGIPLGLLILLVWILISALSFSFTSYLVGTVILKNNNSILKMLIGASLLMIVFLIPILGLIMIVVSHVVGTGMIIDCLSHNLLKSSKK